MMEKNVMRKKPDNKVIKYGTHTADNDYDGFTYSYNTIDSQDFESHIHKCYEFIHIIRGHMIYTVDGTDYMLSDGDIVMTKPTELHSIAFPAECVYQREFLHIYPGFIAGTHPELLNMLDSRKNGYFNRISRYTSEKYGIDVIFKQIERCCADPDRETDFMVYALSLQLITAISRVLRKERPEHQSIVTNKKANAVCEYIDSHYSQNVSLDEIASALYVSQSYMSRVFKREMGMTIKAYLNMRRVMRAKNLIMQGEQITRAFLESGYSDYSTFYRSFVKYAGMSPEDFRHRYI